MRSKIAVLLAFLIFISVSGAAAFAETGKEAVKVEAAKAATKEKLQDMIKLVKSRFDIPDSYTEFNSDINGYENNTSYRLRWSSPSGYISKNGGSLEVMVDEFGNITSYGHYRYNRDYQRRLPKITKSEAVSYAKKFVYQICPDIAGELAFDTGIQYFMLEYDGSYRFYFHRLYKNIPFYDNGISILVSGDNGEITNFSRIWSDDVMFQDVGKVISLEAAQEAYKKKIGLNLKYKRTYGEDNDRTYLEYSPKAGDTNYAIDAVSGEKVAVNPGYNPYNDFAFRSDMYRRESMQQTMEVSLQGQNLDEVKQTEGLISAEAAEKYVKSIEELGIGSGYSLLSYSYGRYGSADSTYAIRMDFAKPLTKDDIGPNIPDEKLKTMLAAGERGQMANIVLNAKTSDIISFNQYGIFGGGNISPKYDKAALQKNAEAFLKKYKPQKYEQLELSSNAVYDEYMMKYGMPNPDSATGFTFIRKANGIPYESNRISMDFDPVTGKIKNYNESWDNISFVSTDGIIGLDKAYETLFKKNGLTLKFVIAQEASAKPAEPVKPGSSGSNLKLVFAPDSRKPVCVDAKTGILIDSFNGEPYTGENAAQYSDIENSIAKDKIMALKELGILFEGENFKPDEVITQKDLLYILGKTKGYNNYIMSKTGKLRQKDLDGMYRMLINDGTIDEDDKNPDLKLTRETAVKYLLDSAGYKKFAELEGLFNCDFIDKNDINPKLAGYAAIARALKIVDGNSYFKPKNEITRAEAAVMIYNYLKK